VSHLAAWSNAAPLDADRSALVELAGVLVGRSETVPLVVRLLTAAVPLDSPQGIVDGLAAVAGAVVDRPRAEQIAADALGTRIALVPDLAEVGRSAAELLAALEDRAHGLFALALLEGGRRLGWPRQWRDVVHQLRRHPVADVRAAALDLVLD